MVTSCCAINCTERHVKGGKVTFHKFPKNEELREIWLEKLRRKNFMPRDSARVCSKHFTEECFDTQKLGGHWLKPNAVPTLFDFRKCVGHKVSKKHPPKRRKIDKPMYTVICHKSEQPLEVRNGTNSLETPISHLYERQATCSNISGKAVTSEKTAESSSKTRFPKDAARRAAWIEAVHRKNWTPTKNSMLCSDHFTEDCFDRTSLSVVKLREYAVPSVFPTYPDHFKKKVERLKNQHEKDFKLRYELENQKKRECLNSSELCYKMDTKNLEKSQIIKQEIFPPNVCRICANICDRLVPIFGDRAKEKGLVTKIHTHLPIMVTVQDALPVNICEDCLGKLNVCHNIVNTCLNADTTLKRMFGLPSEQAEEVFPEGDNIRQPVPVLSATTVTRPVLVPSSASVGLTPVIPNGSLQAEPSTAVAGQAPVKQASAKRAEPMSGEVYSYEMSDAQLVGGKTCPQRREDDRMFPGTRHEVERERPYVCPTCGKAFRDGSALHHHEDIHRDIKYTCKECGKVYSNRSGLYWHAWTHRNATFLCPVCGELVRKGSSVYTHKMKHTSTCQWCGMKFDDWEMLKEHKRMRHKNCPNKCTCCAKQSANTDRKSDVLSSPRKDRWKCEFCGCAFSRQSALSIHMTRKHRCHHCMQCFKDKYELSAHERTHMRKGNAEDEDDKPHSVASAQDSHTVFTCERCGEVFFHVHRYCRHRAECKSLQNWECQICGKVLLDSFGFMVHKQVHSSRKPYRCHFCNKCFGFVNLLKKHSIISHPVLW